MKRSPNNAQLEKLARAFVDAATSLGYAMVDDLEVKDAELAAKVAQGLAQGERLILGLELTGPTAAVCLVTVDGRQQLKRVMHIAGKAPVRH